MIDVDLRRFLPDSTCDAWTKMVDIIPPDAYLAGGTGITAHLKHRVSRDLDFFSTAPLELEALLAAMRAVGVVSVQRFANDTLSVVLDSTKVEVLSTPHIALVRPTHTISGLRVADLADIQAMKLRAVSDRGELRDYFDLMTLDRSHYPTEIGIGLFMEKFAQHVEDRQSALTAVVLALGYLGDVTDDPTLPVGRSEIDAFWRHRQPQIARHLSRFEA